MKIVTWDNHDINDELNYKAVFSQNAYSLAGAKPVMAPRTGRYPVFGALERPEATLDIDIVILNTANRDALAAQLMEWFDPDDETPKKLIIEDNDGSDDRYVYAICQALDNAGAIRRRVYHATLVVDGDVLWASETSATDTWDITATGQTKTLTNGGEGEAYPVLSIKPTSAKASGYLYRRFIPVRWRGIDAATLYPVDIVNNGLDTATLVGVGKMQADGDDVRVLVDGVEVSRWLQDMNDATPQVWVSLDFQTPQEFTLSQDCASAGGITTVAYTTADAAMNFPVSGIFIVGSEAFTYTGIQYVSTTTGYFSGVTRAAHGTTADTHSIGDTGWWCQHEIYLVYGDAALAAPVYGNTGKPIFSLASTNTSWIYADFGVTGENRAGAWKFTGGNTTGYTANRNTTAATWAEIGIGLSSLGRRNGYWYINSPCYITNANFQNGEKYVATGGSAYFQASIDEYRYTTNGWEYAPIGTITAPSAENTWESWSDNQALSSTVTGIRMQLNNFLAYDPWTSVEFYLECADVTLTLNNSYTPTVSIGAEQSSYTLEATITNTTTGEAIEVDFVMTGNQYLEIDSREKTVTYLADNSNQFQALKMVNGPRRDWLRLAPGSNTIQYDETGAAGITIDWEWEERNYH